MNWELLTMALTPKTKRRIRRRNSVARDLHTPKYSQRVVSSKKVYNRRDSKNELLKQEERTSSRPVI
jgi:hypothetical protein